MTDYQSFAKNLTDLKRAERELPDDIKPKGRYHKWYIRTKRSVRDDTNALITAYLLAPFSLRTDVPDESFRLLIKKYIPSLKNSLKQRDPDQFLRTLETTHSSCMVWAITHGGMGKAPQDAAANTDTG